MKEVYPYAIEDLPTNYTLPQGNHVKVNCLVDSDHARDKVLRIPQTVILLYLNSAPIIW